MKLKSSFILILSLVVLLANAEAKIKVLIIDGQNNHAVWPRSTVMMKQYLVETGLFEVDIERSRYTWKGERENEWLPLANAGTTEDLKEPKPDPEFDPSFADYDVVISNFGWKASDWPAKTQRAFEDYVKNGGGFVAVHAANNSFGLWDEYNRMIGIGGWGGRNPDSGIHIYYDNDGKLVRDKAPDGKSGSHGARHEFQITLRNSSHPITRGLPEKWLTSEDECYATLRGPAENMTVLATGKDVSERAPTDRHEPMLMVLDYGKGKVFHTTLGHDIAAVEGVSFIATFLRGTEWAATGKVTQSIPSDFPSTKVASRRDFELKK
jgi:type 1 glutamine amidotransferase